MATSRHLWVRDLLAALDVPGDYYNALAVIAWCQAEGSKARFNPLATTLPMPGATDFNSVHVKNYTSYAQGQQATVATIRQSNMAAIMTALRKGGNSTAVLNAIASSPWGTRPPGGETVASFLDDTRRHWYERAMTPIPGT